MDFLEIMNTRASCRSYNPDRPVSRDDLKKIVEAGRLTPSACNSQPWKFIVIDEPEARAKLCDALVVESGRSGAPWRNEVPAFIIIVEQPAKVMQAVLSHYGNSQHFAAGDIGAACMNMCHEANSLGLSCCVIGMNDQKKMEAHFGIPEGRTARLVLAIGYAAVSNCPAKVRKETEEICSFNQW